MGISSWVYHSLAEGINFVEDPSLIAVFALTVLIYFLLNSGLLSVVIGLSEGISPKIIWIKNHSWTISYLVVLAAIGYLMVMVNLGLGKWAIVVLLLPVLLTRKIYSQYLDLQKMQDKLVHSERLAAIGQMAAGISHEIANPIGIIMGYSDYLLKSTDTNDSKIEDIQTIRKEAERCKQTLQDFSTFSRPVAKFQSMDINAAVQNSISLLKHESKSRSVKIVFDKSPVLPSIMGDMKQLEQVFINIMLNAFQAMPKGGSLKIRTSLDYNPVKKGRPFMSRMWKKEGDDAVVCVEFKDTGSGIPKECMDQLFMPFFTSRSQEGGRGLGLYISHQILKEHDGEISIDSELGEGTLVSVTIPLQRNK
jgi:two-component system NtrC family sensor kinase